MIRRIANPCSGSLFRFRPSVKRSDLANQRRKNNIHQMVFMQRRPHEANKISESQFTSLHAEAASGHANPLMILSRLQKGMQFLMVILKGGQRLGIGGKSCPVSDPDFAVVLIFMPIRAA